MRAPAPRTPGTFDRVLAVVMALVALLYFSRFFTAQAPEDLSKAVGFSLCVAALVVRLRTPPGERIGTILGMQLAGFALVLYGLFGF